MTAADFSLLLSSKAVRPVRMGGLDRQELRMRLQNAGIRFNEAAECLFEDERFVTSPDERILYTVEVSAGYLGLCAGGTFAAIVERAGQLGLALCPLELGPHLRLQFTEPAAGLAGEARTSPGAPPGSITVASPPIADDDETPKGFYLRRIDGIRWLRGYYAPLDHVWNAHDRLVFCHAHRAA